MTWLKLSDDFPMDVSDLSDAAFRLHIEGLCYVMEKMTEGRVQKSRLRRIASNSTGDGGADGLDELLGARYLDEHGNEQTLWEDAGDHFRIAHQMEHQPSKAEVDRRRTVARVNGSKGGRPPKDSKEPSSEPTSEPSSVYEDEETHAGNPSANPDRNPTGRAGTGKSTSPLSPENGASEGGFSGDSDSTASAGSYESIWGEPHPMQKPASYDINAGQGSPVPAFAKGQNNA